MCRHTRRISSCSSARTGSDSVRSVPSMSADSGITLFVVPATIRAMVSTAGWWASTRRVSAVCSAPTIAAAAGTGSSASCGAEAWPPRPVTRTRIASAAAISDPGRVCSSPAGRVALTCSAYAATGRPPGPCRSSSPSSIMTRAPW